MIYEKAGIFIAGEKIYLLKRYVEKCMNEKGTSNITDYLKFLKYFDLNGAEFNKLISDITIRKTHFFREFPQLRIFAEHCLPDVVENSNVRCVRILSASCSTGEEPYTLSIICSEMLGGTCQYSIDALDIDDNAFQKAKIGVYDERSVKDVPKAYLKKYFRQTLQGYEITEEVKKCVRFYKTNFFDRQTLLSLGKNYHFIFCRNMLIYFSDDSRRRVVETFYEMMVPGGYIFLDHSESLS